MDNTERVIDKLDGIPQKHELLKGLFNVFQGNLSRLEAADFPLSCIQVETASDSRSIVRFLDREYEIRFGSVVTGNSVSGSISICRVLNRSGGKITELTSRTFNNEAVVSIQPPSSHQSIRLSDESECITLVLNWIYDEINS